MIICFAEDACQAIFDSAEFYTYDSCMLSATPGERFHGICNRISAPGDGRFVFINAIIAQAMELFLKNGGKPTLSLRPEPTSI